jgi:3-oxoacyl-[acyl-carrier protein] reductase
VKSVFLNTQTAVRRAFLRQEYGKVLNFTSHAGVRGTASYSAYAASKMAIVGLTMVWAHELARVHINVNCIGPAAWTDMLSSTTPERQATLKAHFARSNVLQRVGEADDVAPTALFLVSDDAQYVTGQVLLVNGEPMYVM